MFITFQLVQINGLHIILFKTDCKSSVVTYAVRKFLKVEHLNAYFIKTNNCQEYKFSTLILFYFF